MEGREEAKGTVERPALPEEARPPPPSGEQRASYRSAVAVGVLTLLSRVTGLAREATRAHFLGTGLAADAFQVAFQLPNLLRRLVGEGAVSSALVPVVTRHSAECPEAEQRVFAEKLLTLWLVLVAAVTVTGVWLGPELVELVSWGTFSAAGKSALTQQLTGLLFWYLLFVGMSAAFQGILNAHGFFAVPSTAPLLFNLAFVACGWAVAPLLPPERRVFALAGGVIAGGVLQLAVMVPLIWRLGVRPRPRWPLDHEGVRRVLRLFLPAVFGAGVYQVNVLLSTVLAMRLPEQGAVAVLAYSGRLMEVVLGVYVFALSTVSLTTLSRQAAEADLSRYCGTLTDVLRLVVFITLPSTVGLYLLREPILSLLLESGAFDDRSLRMTARAFQYHALGIAFVGVSRVLVNGFYALHDVATPVRIATINLVFHVGAAWLLSEGPLGYAGIALASTLAVLFQAALLWKALAARVPELGLARLLVPAGRMAAAAALMGAVVAVTRGFIDLEAGKLVQAVELAAVILTGAAAFLAAARFLRLPEAARIVEGGLRLLRRGRR